MVVDHSARGCAVQRFHVCDVALVARLREGEFAGLVCNDGFVGDIFFKAWFVVVHLRCASDCTRLQLHRCSVALQRCGLDAGVEVTNHYSVVQWALYGSRLGTAFSRLYQSRFGSSIGRPATQLIKRNLGIAVGVQRIGEFTLVVDYLLEVAPNGISLHERNLIWSHVVDMSRNRVYGCREVVGILSFPCGQRTSEIDVF